MWRLLTLAGSSELFGPILPIIEVDCVDEAIQIVAERYELSLSQPDCIFNFNLQTISSRDLPLYEE